MQVIDDVVVSAKMMQATLEVSTLDSRLATNKNVNKMSRLGVTQSEHLLLECDDDSRASDEFTLGN